MKDRLNVEEDLHAAEGMWQSPESTPKTFSGGTGLLDGNYVCEILVAYPEKAKGAGQLQVNFHLEVKEPADLMGRGFHRYDQLATPSNMGWFKGAMQRLGLTVPQTVAELPAFLAGMVGMIVATRLETRKDFQNVHFDKILSAPKLT